MMSTVLRTLHICARLSIHWRLICWRHSWGLLIVRSHRIWYGSDLVICCCIRFINGENAGGPNTIPEDPNKLRLSLKGARKRISLINDAVTWSGIYLQNYYKDERRNESGWDSFVDYCKWVFMNRRIEKNTEMIMYWLRNNFRLSTSEEWHHFKIVSLS